MVAHHYRVLQRERVTGRWQQHEDTALKQVKPGHILYSVSADLSAAWLHRPGPSFTPGPVLHA